MSVTTVPPPNPSSKTPLNKFLESIQSLLENHWKDILFALAFALAGALAPPPGFKLLTAALLLVLGFSFPLLITAADRIINFTSKDSDLDKAAKLILLHMGDGNSDLIKAATLIEQKLPDSSAAYGIMQSISKSVGIRSSDEFTNFQKIIERLEPKSSLPNSGQVDSAYNIEHTAWETLIKTYLNDQAKQISEKRSLRTNTRYFTTLYSDATKMLSDILSSKSSNPKAKITRYHITGMLPEEFYNGPQIAYLAGDSNTGLDSQPFFFSREWSDYSEFYRPRQFDNVSIKRCIVVRSANLREKDTNALSTDTLLHNQANLMIARDSNKLKVHPHLNNECSAVADRLFIKCGNNQKENAMRSPDNIIGVAEAYYYPIIDAANCPGTSMPCHAEWEPLLDQYIEQFHSANQDAFYCLVNNRIWADILQSFHLKKCFQEGRTPEIVLFGDESCQNWHFGFLGLYRPFTTDIDLVFLTSDDSKKLYEEFRANLGTGENLSGLSRRAMTVQCQHRKHSARLPVIQSSSPP